MAIAKSFIQELVVLCLLMLATSFLSAQKQVFGKVTDCENNPLPGVFVVVDSIVKITDIDGLYKITVPDTTAIISYNYVGMISQKTRIGKRDTINISLKENPEIMDSVITVKKPVIYLYPKTKIAVSLQIAYSGKLLFTYPKYNNGWEVVAYPNGKLINKDDGKEYSYLFWDGEKSYKKAETTYKKGYVVHKDSIVSFLEDKLKAIGLQPNEYNDFIVFWTPYLMQNDWNFIHFRIGNGYDVVSKNTVNPQPETVIRVFMDFKGLSKPFVIEPQEITTPSRKGFTLVEWGGAELKQIISVQTESGKYIEK